MEIGLVRSTFEAIRSAPRPAGVNAPAQLSASAATGTMRARRPPDRSRRLAGADNLSLVLS